MALRNLKNLAAVLLALFMCSGSVGAVGLLPYTVSISQLSPELSIRSTPGLMFSSGGNVVANDGQQAWVWSYLNGGLTKLDSSGFDNSWVRSAYQGNYVGFGQSGNYYNALLWKADGTTVVLQDPSGPYFDTMALGISGLDIVGAGYADNKPHALLWSGEDNLQTALHPEWLDHSVAINTAGGQQVGSGADFEGSLHALLWHGSAESVIDLTPGWCSDAKAYATDGLSQVGVGNDQALLWSGTPESVINLHPDTFDFSFACGVGGGIQVGAAGRTSAEESIYYPLHAGIWKSSSESFYDLHLLLPSRYLWSIAHCVDNSGSIYGTAYNQQTNRHDLVVWKPTPEPSSIISFAVGLVTLAGYFRRKGVI